MKLNLRNHALSLLIISSSLFFLCCVSLTIENNDMNSAISSTKQIRSLSARLISDSSINEREIHFIEKNQERSRLKSEKSKSSKLFPWNKNKKEKNESKQENKKQQIEVTKNEKKTENIKKNEKKEEKATNNKTEKKTTSTQSQSNTNTDTADKIIERLRADFQNKEKNNSDDEGTVKEYDKYNKKMEETMNKYSKKVPKIPVQQAPSNKQRQKMTKTTTSQGSVRGCSSSSGVMKFDGQCTGDLLNNSFFKNILPEPIREYKGILNKAIEIVGKVAKLPEMCLGDFDPQVFGTNPTLKHNTCADLPLAPGNKYSLVSFKLSDIVPCPERTTIDFCLAFNKCGSVSLAVNGGIISCGLTASGIGTVLTPFTDFIGDIGISICPRGSLLLPIDLPMLKGDSIEIVPYNFSGHFSITGGLTIPFEKISGELGKKLDEYFEITSRVGMMLDLGIMGKSNDLYQNLLTILKNVKTPEKFVNSILDVIKGAQKFGLQVNSAITLKLNEITKGFLPDIEIELNKQSIGVFLKEENGVQPGIYLYINSNVGGYGLIVKAIKSVLNNFSFVFKALGISTPELPDGNIEISIIINTQYIAFEIEAPRFAGITCKFKRIADQAKWILRKATAFFESTGESVMKIGQGAGKFAEKSAKAAYKYLMKQSKQALEIYKQANEELEKMGNTVSRETIEAYKTAIGKTKSVLENSHKSLKKVAKKGTEVLFMAMDTLWDFANDGKKLKYLKKIGKKMENELKDKVKKLEEEAENLGKNLGKYSGKALESAKREAEKAKKMAEKTKKKLKDVIDKVDKVIDDIEDELKDFFEDVGDTIKGWFS